MKQGPIETNLRLFFTADDVDVTQDLLPDLWSFTYDDKETNEADCSHNQVGDSPNDKAD